jgi:ABC-type glycerol-3-phosphate transport system substrate-binding protein
MTKFLITLCVLAGTLTLWGQRPVVALETQEISEVQTLILPSYQDTWQHWVSEGYDMIDTASHVFFSMDITEHTGTLITSNDQDSILLESGQSVFIDVSVETTGLYALKTTYISRTTSIKPIRARLSVNGRFPYDDATRYELPTLWQQDSHINQDRFGNDIVPRSTQVYQPLSFDFVDNVGLYQDPMLVLLEVGKNTLELNIIDGTLDLLTFTVHSLPKVPSYADYRQTHTGSAPEGMLHLQGEDITLKSDPSIRSGNDRGLTVTPFALMESRLNVLDGSTFSAGRQAVFYDVEVPQTGYYQLSFKVLQNGMINTSVYRHISINGTVPFAEARHLEIPFNRQFQYFTPNHEGEPLLFYLESGTQTIGLHVDMTSIRPVYLSILDLMRRMNQTTLDIQKVTGNQLDANRDWDLLDYMPDLVAELDRYIVDLEAVYNAWVAYHGTGSSPIATALRQSVDRMRRIASEPDELPRNMNLFSVGSGSILALIGNVIPMMIQSPLTIDAFYLHHPDAELPSLSVSLWRRAWVSVQRFFLSFFSDQYIDTPQEGELEVWVNRGRAYVDLMQQMADSLYTPETGQKVRISLMPDENKLILANAAGAQPDLAMGVAAWRPFEFAVRNSLYDLRSFDNFDEVAQRFAPGSFVGLIYQEGVYALPETQNFQLLFYRKDVLETLELEVPDTWDDVILMLPELQRFGMNFYIPLANNAAFKSFDTTYPFIAQHRGNLFSEDGMSVAYDDPQTLAALQLMTRLFTTFAMPVEIGSFYQNFRYGNLPIGIGDFSMYVQLLNAAPEIAGLWDIALLPGVAHDDEIDRSFVGAATVNVIFDDSRNKQEAWDFLTWWTDTNTQILYAENLLTTYGSAFLWNTANLDAFLGMSWDRNHQQVIYEQWSYVNDPVKVPGSYMVERELSNIWNRVVFDGVTLRTAVEDGAVIANREIRRKMVEFGYLSQQGLPLRPYLIPDRDTVVRWRVGDE